VPGGGGGRSVASLVSANDTTSQDYATAKHHLDLLHLEINVIGTAVPHYQWHYAYYL
jgi:hypothetical protein